MNNQNKQKTLNFIVQVKIAEEMMKEVKKAILDFKEKGFIVTEIFGDVIILQDKE